ncbi:MAG: hypothetical protein JNJ58_12435 [Chitinophagaceae bacterium]|nr:hypothetical protein [Chitinophagaceae bacterium]
MANYTNKLEKLKNRRQDIITKAFSLNENFNKKTYGESTTYALEAMEEISAEYTNNTYKQVMRVQNHLKPGLNEYGIDVDFRYQGSVPTNTHIKLYSDIDLLAIHQKFYTLEPPLRPTYPYLGDTLADLKELRSRAFRILDTVFTSCDIDDSGGKALTISGGSLNRKIDIISSNWHNTVRYQNSNDEVYRGVKILDRDNNKEILNFPFMHIHCINQKDIEVGGNEKRVIRLLKSIKADADENINVSSYDIASLVYRMDNSYLHTSRNQRIVLINNTNQFLTKVINDKTFRESLYVANGTRRLFCNDGTRLEEVVKLQKEVEALVFEIAKELKPLNESIEKSIVYY